MKCAVVFIFRDIVRSDLFWTTSSYHAGDFESKNEMRHASLVSSRMRASVDAVQPGAGWRIGACGDSRQRSPGSLSQRRVPMITPAGPLTIWYESRFGATSFQRVTIACCGLDASRSCETRVRRLRKVRAARATSADASRGGQGRGIRTSHFVVRLLRRTFTSTVVGAPPAAAVAR